MVRFAPDPTKLVAVTIPVTFIPVLLEVTAEPTTADVAVTIPLELILPEVTEPTAIFGVPERPVAVPVTLPSNPPLEVVIPVTLIPPVLTLRTDDPKETNVCCPKDGENKPVELSPTKPILGEDADPGDKVPSVAVIIPILNGEESIQTAVDPIPRSTSS